MIQGDTWGCWIHCPTSWALLPPALGASQHIPTPLLAHTTTHPCLFYGISPTPEGLGVKKPFLHGWGTQHWDSKSTVIPRKLGISNGWIKYPKGLTGIWCSTTSCLSPNLWRASPPLICGSKNHCQQHHPSQRDKKSQAAARRGPENLFLELKSWLS